MPRSVAQAVAGSKAMQRAYPNGLPETPTRVSSTRAGFQYGQAAESALQTSLSALGIHFEVQYPWGKELNPPRRYRSDAAIPTRRLLIEVIGNAHAAGHAKLARDTERHQLATMHGWVILPVTPAQARDGTAALLVQAWLNQAEKASSREGVSP